MGNNEMEKKNPPMEEECKPLTDEEFKEYQKKDARTTNKVLRFFKVIWENSQLLLLIDFCTTKPQLHPSSPRLHGADFVFPLHTDQLRDVLQVVQHIGSVLRQLCQKPHQARPGKSVQLRQP